MGDSVIGPGTWHPAGLSHLARTVRLLVMRTARAPGGCCPDRRWAGRRAGRSC